MGFEVDKCCFFIKLRPACLIIGYVNLVYEIAYILSVISYLFYIRELPGANDDIKAMNDVSRGLLFLLILFAIVYMAFTIVLLVGIHRCDRGYVKASLIFIWFGLAVFIIVLFVRYAMSRPTGFIIARDLIYIYLCLYELLVIRSYYLKMEDPANQPGATV